MDGTFTVVSSDAEDGAIVSTDYNGTNYQAVVNSNVAVIVVPEADLIDETRTSTIFLTAASGTDSETTELFNVDGPDVYAVLDVAAAVAGFEVREYVNSDATDTSGALVTSITPNEQYVIRSLWQDTDGVYAGDSVGDLQFMDVTLGSESFVGRDGTTNYNLYLYTAPTTNATVQDATFTYGKYTDSTLSTLLLVSVPVEVSVLVSAGLSTAGMDQFNIPATAVAEGDYDATDWSASVSPYASLYWETNGTNFASVENIGGELAFKTRMIPESDGSSRVGAGATMSSPATSAKLTQSVFLEDGFDWGGTNEGGKLGFGFRGGPDGSAASGGSGGQDEGFTCRFMWRANGEVDIYVYDADTAGYGDSYYTGYFLQPNQWEDLAMEVGMNTAGVADGTLRAWANGNLILDRSDMKWFQTGTPQIDTIQHLTFYGGDDSSWSPDGTYNIWFKDIYYGAGTW